MVDIGKTNFLDPLMTWSDAPIETSRLANTALTIPPPSSPETIELTADQFRALLRNLLADAGTIAELARRLGVTGQYLSSVLDGRKGPGHTLVESLGGKVVIRYEVPISRIDEDAAEGSE